MYIVSSCLLGENCKYSGGNNYNENVVKFLKNHNFIGVCPEEEGGLSTPRPPAEIKEGKVINNLGQDVSLEFQKGAKLSYEKAKDKAKNQDQPIEGAILKSKSPSCGKGPIYDGSFTGVLIDGKGLFAKLLIDNNIKVISEEEIG